MPLAERVLPLPGCCPLLLLPRLRRRFQTLYPWSNHKSSPPMPRPTPSRMLPISTGSRSPNPIQKTLCLIWVAIFFFVLQSLRGDCFQPQSSMFHTSILLERRLASIPLTLLYNAQSNLYLQGRHFGLCEHLKTRASEHAQCFHHSIHGRPDIHDVLPEATPLARSIPASTLGFSSSSLPSPLPEQLALSALNLTREVHQIHMGLSMEGADCSSQQQTNWVPRLWEKPLGGPLVEVLNSTNATTNSSMEAKNSSALNLIAQGWGANSPLVSSPTGVLQKTAFGILSCSSTGSSPRPEISKFSEDYPLDDPLVP